MEKEIEELKAKLKESESKTKEARDDAAKYRTKLRDTSETFEGVDIEEYKSLKALKKKNEEQEALKKGEYDRLISERTAAFEEKIKAETEASKDWQNKYESKIVSDSIKHVAESNNALNPEDVLTFVKSKYGTAVSEDGSIKLLKESGETVTDGKGNPLTVDEAVKDLLNERSYLVNSQNTGAGNKGGTGSGAAKDMTAMDRIKKGLQNL